ncbi:MAG: hypothetical protein EBX36_13980, partial [Planctomycetia bacterium]|nr:hypothetical protein [Planctomycetia bacterium]
MVAVLLLHTMGGRVSATANGLESPALASAAAEDQGYAFFDVLAFQRDSGATQRPLVTDNNTG